MSAIWGAISFTEKKLPEAIPTVFRRAFETCVLDRIEELRTDTVYMGCGIQYVTKEAEGEVLPKQEGDSFFTADVVLDNREELLQELGITIAEGKQLPDGELLFRMYCGYEREALGKLLGAFAFVHYNQQKKEASLVIDAVGDRMVYYAIHEEILYFSSLLMPLVELTKAELNDRWLTDFLAMDHLFMINETEETPFQNIYRVAPAYEVKVSLDGVEKYRYWEPAKTVKKLRLKSDEEYEAAFQELFVKVVQSKLRDGAPMSALLSGGYDSTAVVSVASHLLKSSGQRIISFTSVPLKDYQVNEGYYVEDETMLVRKTVEFLGNIDPFFVDMPGVDPWNGHEACMSRMEMPYKSSLNFLWIPECMKQAREKGARMMLTGSYGNTSISYENVEVYLSELKRKGHFLRLRNEIKVFAKTYGVDEGVLKAKIYKRRKKRCEDRRWTALYRKSFVRPSIIASTGGDERMLRLNRSVKEANTYKKQRKLMMHELSLRQIGEVGVKNSLATGVLMRDPTKDKRIIEFCMSLPMEQFNKNGESRRLVSRYLRKYMPPHIFEKEYRGRQSADYSYRLSLDWENIRQQWMEQCKTCADSRYVDAGYEYIQLKKQQEISNYSQMDLTRHVYTQMVLEYEEKYGKKTKVIAEEEIRRPLISIIIPVYNAMEHLDKCLDSVQKQTYSNLEIIVVDDGSTDGSEILCDRYAENDCRIKVLHQKNGGVAKARNAALEIVTGEYIGFVDSDDYIAPTMYEEMLEAACKYGVSLVGCGVECIDYNGKDITACEGFTFVYQGVEMLESFLGYSRRTTTVAISVWNKLFHRDLIGSKRFMEIKKYEDLEFTWTLMSICPATVFIDKPLYHYEMRMNGLHNQKYGVKELQEFIQMEQSVLKAIQENGNIRREGYLNHVFYFYSSILDWLLGKKGILDQETRRLAQKSLFQMRKDIKEALLKNARMRRKEKIVWYSGVYSIRAYRMLEKALICNN